MLAFLDNLFHNTHVKTQRNLAVAFIQHAIETTDTVGENARQVNEELKKLETMRMGH